MSYQENKFREIADAIREKKGTVEPIPAVDFAEAIRSIEAGQSKYYLKYLEITDAGISETMIPVAPGDVVALREGRNVAECNVGTKEYTPELVFDGWVSPFEIVDNTITLPACLSSDVVVSASYSMPSGKSVFVLILTKANSNNSDVAETSINFTVRNRNLPISIEWGDGNTEVVNPATTTLSVPHTYGSYGVKIVKVDAPGADLGHGWNNNGAFGVGAAGRAQLYSVFHAKVVTALNNPFGASPNLTLAVCPSNLTALNIHEFRDCVSLDYVFLPAALVSINYYVFTQCRKLRVVALPSGLTTLGLDVFSYCSALESQVIPSGIPYLQSRSFYTDRNLKGVTLMPGLQEIRELAFESCTSLRDLQIPESVTRIDRSVFNNVPNLFELRFPSQLTEFNTNLLASCTGLSSVEIPVGVVSIMSGVFNSCTGLSHITMRPVTPPALESADQFSTLNSSVRIYVPVGSLAAYQSAANWSGHANKMYEDTPQNRALFED